MVWAEQLRNLLRKSESRLEVHLRAMRCRGQQRPLADLEATMCRLGTLEAYYKYCVEQGYRSCRFVQPIESKQRQSRWQSVQGACRAYLEVNTNR